MGKVTGFLEIDRQVHKYQPASDRIRHFREFTLPMSDKEVEKQAARCMDCGVPFCHTGCPVNNLIPDWNSLVSGDDWRAALEWLPRFRKVMPVEYRRALAEMKAQETAQPRLGRAAE